MIKVSENKDYVALLKADKIKAIFSDLDNTLWKGTLAEGEKPIINLEYYNLLKELYKKGILVFIVSKNDEKDVEKAFKDLNIDKEMFTAVICNWDSKYLNIEKLIEYTELRPETVIFVDDNPLERNEAKLKLNKINCIDALDWGIIKEIEYIKKSKEQSLSEIKTRINRYKTAIHSKELSKNFGKEDINFYKKLNRELCIGEIDPDNLGRFTRLLVETHRINFNPKRFSVYDTALEYLYNRLNKGDRLFAISTKENGSSLGLTGALVISLKDKTATITDGTFSCGIIGRQFEQRSIIALISILKKLKIDKLNVIVTLSSTNQRVRNIFEDLNFLEESRGNNQVVYSVIIDKFKPKNNYDWIKIDEGKPDMDYPGHLAVISFFEENVKPLMEEKFKVINLGSARGEVLGHLQEDIKNKFYAFLKNNKIDYKKVDIQFYPEENNLVGNAEDLKGIIKDNSQDLVMAVELLEHTEHFWNVINEIIRICKINGYIFISVPAFNYPKHEYPIDLWRIGSKTLSSFFPKESFKILKLELEGDKEMPRRVMILVQKIKEFTPNYTAPKTGKTNWETGITIFD